MNAKKISYGGIGTALGVLILFLTRVIPINTLALLTLASCIIPLIIIKTDVKTAIYVYFATALIGFFITPGTYSLMYALIFGVYGIIKYYIEKLNKLYIEIILKYVYFNITLVISYLLIGSLVGAFNISLPLWIFIILAEISFAIYDYALTVVISFFLNSIIKRK